MPKCYILCNLNNIDSGYIVSNYAGSSLSYYLGSLASKFSDVVFINVGAPSKRWAYKEKEHICRKSNYSIVEFPCGPSIFPVRIKAKLMIRKAASYILNNKTDEDYILIYHSISFCGLYSKFLDAFGKNHAILHVAEFYSEVNNVNISVENEIKYLRLFSKHIFMSPAIARRVTNQSDDMKSILIYGSYNDIETKENQNNGLINVIYAGTSSRIKGGLYSALKASKHLSENFKLHIFCDADESIEKEIRNYNVIYEGYVEEKKLWSIMNNFDIGLSTQNPTLPFNNSSFPSKIVNYLACGLNVVSSKSKSVFESPFSDYVMFYDEDNDGLNLAKAIIESSKHVNKIKNQEIVKRLNIRAQSELRELFETTL